MSQRQARHITNQTYIALKKVLISVSEIQLFIALKIKNSSKSKNDGKQNKKKRNFFSKRRLTKRSK